MTTDIKRILEEREETHGDYRRNAKTFWLLSEALGLFNGDKYAPDMHLGLIMICAKLARIANGNPTVADHWDDIIGYVRLIEGSSCNGPSNK